MVKLKHSEWDELDHFISYSSGYVLDFSSKKKFSEFFEDELNVDIFDPKFETDGGSMGKRLRAFINDASPQQAGKLLRALWKHKTKDERNEWDAKSQLGGMDFTDVEFFELSSHEFYQEDESFNRFVSTIEAKGADEIMSVARIMAEQFNFNTVMHEIDRATQFVNDDPEGAITASSSLIESLCKSILDELGMTLPKDQSIKGLYKEIREPLGLSADSDAFAPEIATDVRTVLAALSNVVMGIGALRTHGGTAHGRKKGHPRVDARIARLSVNTSAGIAIFIIESWARKYPDRKLENSEASNPLDRPPNI